MAEMNGPARLRQAGRPARQVYIHTFGCQMNKLDSELIADELINTGYLITEDQDQADVILFNTCSVRQHAEERVYSYLGALKHLKARRPELIIGVIGCMAQKDKENIIARVPYVNLVVGPHRYKNIPGLIQEIRQKQQVVIRTDEQGLASDGYRRNLSAQSHSYHAYVKGMQGCDNFCTYCIVPYVRGREISRPLNDIINETRLLADNGTKEITLLGQNITSYGKTLDNKTNLAKLLVELDKISGLERIRFITSHPSYITTELLEAMRDLSKVVKYLHIPAQSGSNRILKAMNRGYTREEYLALVKQAREIVPGIELVSDFIVGFPGEQEEDFQDTVRLLKETRFRKCFVFKYCPRPGTQAANRKDDVPLETKKQRNNLLLQIAKEVTSKKYDEHL